MLSRRTTARLRFLGGLYRVIDRGTRILETKADEPSRIERRYVLLGLSYQVARGLTYDRDWGNVRTNDWRHLFTSIALFGLALNCLGSMTETERESLLFGSAVGTTLYRFWYGVCYPLPGTNE